MAELDWLMHQAKRYPLLNAKQEIELSRQVQTWLSLKDKLDLTAAERSAVRAGRRAYDRFFMSNIGMVVKLANRFNHTQIAGSMTLEDLVQEGIFGLQRAIVMFDATRGYKFSTYAFNWIRQCICRGVERRAQMIYMPCTTHDMIRKARKYMREQEQLVGRTPTVAEAAAALGYEEAKLRKALHFNLPIFSLDQPAQASSDGRLKSNLVEMLASDAPDPCMVAEIDNVMAAIPRLLQTLEPKQQEILRRRYLDSEQESYGEIAKDWGVSREAVRLTHDRTMRQLRMRFSVVATPDDIQALQCA